MQTIRVYEASAASIEFDDDGQSVSFVFTAGRANGAQTVRLDRSAFDNFLASATAKAKDNPKPPRGSSSVADQRSEGTSA